MEITTINNNDVSTLTTLTTIEVTPTEETTKSDGNVRFIFVPLMVIVTVILLAAMVRELLSRL